MAAKRRAARKAQKPKFIEVDGRQLKQAEYEIYRRKLAGRVGIISRAEQQAQTLALSDLDHQKRPSSHAAEIVLDLGHRGSRASLALGSLRDFAFYEATKDPKLVELVNAVIGHCAAELEAVAAEVRTLHKEIASEVSAEVNHG